MCASTCICARSHVPTSYTELPPTPILFLFFNATVFFNLKLQLKTQPKYIFCFPVQKRGRCLGSIDLHCNSSSDWLLCKFKALRLRWTILDLCHSTEGKSVEPHIFPRKLNKNLIPISVFL